jgi:hypothetical protein
MCDKLAYDLIHPQTSRVGAEDQSGAFDLKLPFSRRNAMYLARYVEMIRDAHDQAAEHFLMTVGALSGEPAVPYVALDYAYHAGVTVTIAAC